MAETALRIVVERARQLAAAEATTGPTDRELLERFVRSRDEAAFTALVQRHTAMVLGVCRRVLRHGQDAEDAGQATFLVLARTAASIHKRTALASWLYGVAYRISRNMQRGQARGRVRELRNGVNRPCTCRNEASWLELQAALDEAIMSLPERYRAPLVLCYLEERTRDEAAQLLGMTLSTLRGRLERGRSLARAELTRRGFSLPGGLLLAALTAEAGSAAAPVSFVAAAVGAAFGRAVGPAARRVTLLADGMANAVSATRIATAFAILIVACLGVGAAMIGKPGEKDAPAPDGFRVALIEDDRPPAGHPPRRDVFGDPLPPDAIARLGTVRLRPGGFIDHVAFTPDGKQLVAFGPSNDISVWDAASGEKLLHDAAKATGAMTYWHDALLTSDGRFIVTLEGFLKGQTIRLRDRADLKLIREIPVDGLARPRLTPDGKLLLAIRSDGDHSDVEVWDLKDGKRVRSWRAHQARLWHLELAQDGKTAATASENTLHVWDVATGKLIREIGGLAKSVHILALAPDGKLVASASVGSGREQFGPFTLVPRDKRLRIWNVESGQEQSPLQLESGRQPIGFIMALFSPDGKQLVTVCSDGVLRIWDARTSKLARQHALGQRSMMSLGFSPDGRTLAIGTTSIRLLDWRTGKDKHPAFGHELNLSAPAVSADGRTVVTCTNGPIRSWDGITGQPRQVLAGHDSTVVNGCTSIRLLGDGRTLVSAGMDKTVRLWDLATGQERRRADLADVGLPLAIAEDGSLVALLHQVASIRLVESATGKERHRLSVGAEQFSRATFVDDDRKLIVWKPDHTAQVWDVVTGKAVRQLAFPERKDPSRADHDGYAAAVSPDGRFMAYGSMDGRLAIFEVASGRQLHLIKGLAKGGPAAVAFCPDGRSLAWSSQDANIQVVELATGNSRPAWSDRSQARVHVLELATGKERLHFDGHHGPVGSLTYSGDGRTLVSTSADTTALLWDVPRSRSSKGEAMDPDAAWRTLAVDDAAEAYRAMCRLAASPQDAVALLRQRIEPAPRPDEKRVAKLLADLDSAMFEVREAAQTELAKLGDTAVGSLRAALQTAASLELRRRLEGLLEKYAADWSMPNPDRLRLLRSVEVLEMAGTAECRALLQRLAEGRPGTRLTDEATASLRRLAKR